MFLDKRSETVLKHSVFYHKFSFSFITLYFSTKFVKALYYALYHKILASETPCTFEVVFCPFQSPPINIHPIISASSSFASSPTEVSRHLNPRSAKRSTLSIWETGSGKAVNCSRQIMYQFWPLQAASCKIYSLMDGRRDWLDPGMHSSNVPYTTCIQSAVIAFISACNYGQLLRYWIQFD